MSASVLITACALASAALMFGEAVGSRSWGLGLTAAVFTAAFFGERLRLNAIQQTVTSMAVAVVAASAVFGFLDPGELHPFFALFGVAALAVGSTRLVFHAPRGGQAATVGIGLATVLSCGTLPLGSTFELLLVGYLVLGLLAMRASDPGGIPWWRAEGRRKWVGTMALGVAFALAIGLAGFLPWLYDRVTPWTPRFRGEPRSGFSGQSLTLGSLRDLLLSDRVVLRIHGDTPSHLRGEVYRRYDDGRWARDRRPAPDAPLVGEQQIEVAALNGIEPVEVWVAADRVQHVFLPLGWGALHVEPDTIRMTRVATVRTAPLDLERYQFTVQPDLHQWPDTPSGEEGNDYHISSEQSSELRAVLRATAGDWTAEATTPRQRMEELQRVLRSEFEYSTQYTRERGRDVVLQFLEDRTGHCEYFASALALLGRAVGVPTRVIGGYHVTERNPFGDYAVVRERDAHAWVEAYLPNEGWVVFDPTPPSEIQRSHAAFFAALVDWLTDQFRRRGPLSLIVPLGLLLLFVVIRGLLRGRERKVSTERVLEYDRPPAFVPELLEALAADGHVRRPHEPWTRLRDRLHEAGNREWATLIDRVIANRYDTAVDDRALESDVRSRIAASNS